MFNSLVPWDSRIKRVESYFGSSVSSFFTLLSLVSAFPAINFMMILYETILRWLCYLNICISILIIAFVTVPEMLIGAKAKDKAYKATLYPYNFLILTIYSFNSFFPRNY